MTRPAAVFGTAFLVAMLAASALPLSVLPSLILAVTVGILLCAPLRSSPLRATCWTVLAGALAGILCFFLWAYPKSFDFSALSGETHRICGTVREIKASGTRLALTVDVTEHDIPGAPGKFTAIAYVSGETPADFGDRADITGKCLAMSSLPDFDMGEYYFSQGISLLLSSYREVTLRTPERRPLSYFFRHWNWALGERADSLYPEPYAGMVRALLLGDDNGLDPVLYNSFSRTGITHVFVVSGLHVSLMAGAVLLLGRRLSPRLRAAFGCAAAWGFVALTGFGYPAARAGIMSTAACLSALFRRPGDRLTSLVLAGMLIAAVNPGAVASGSFQLSMSATLGVILLAEPVSEKLDALFLLRGENPFTGLLGCSIGANLTMLPFLLRMFGGMSLLFPAANLLVLPILPAALAAAALSLLCPPPVTEGLVWVTRELLRLVSAPASLLAKARPLYLGLEGPLAALFLFVPGAALLAVGLLCRKKRLGKRAAAGITAAILLLLPCALGVQRALDAETVEITPVYSFNGVSVVIRQGNRAAVVCLDDDGQTDEQVEALLRRQNVWTVDSLILAYDGPAALSDTVFLTEVLPTGRVFVPEEADYAPYIKEILSPSEGVYFLEEGRGFSTELSSGKLDIWEDCGSVAVRLTVGGTRVVITDSISPGQELDCDILFYGGDSLSQIKSLPLRYAVLLSEPVEEEALPDRILQGWKEPVCLLLNRKGELRISG